MKANIAIGVGHRMELKGALLVYSAANRAFCSWHEAHGIDTGEARLGPAAALSSDFLRSLAEGLSTSVSLEILPVRVLARAEGMIVWWTPATVRPMFLRRTDDACELSGKRLPQPALVWRVRGCDLSIRALAKNTRPEAGSRLFVAPYFNTDGENGSVCQGSMRSPNEDRVDAISLWEQAFFQSEFTHQTGSRKLTAHPGGFHGLWRSLAGKSRFPTRFLVPANETLLEFAQREH